MFLKAPHIVTVEGRLLQDHAVCVEDGLIRRLLPHKEIPAGLEILELPQTILLPGLVNAHCHLELSRLPEPLPFPGTCVGWIDQLTKLKLRMTPEKTESAIRFGIAKLLEGGTTTVADHMSLGTSLQILMDSPLDVVVYLEVLGVERQRAEAFYRQAGEIQKSNTKNDEQKFKIILTPHATYSLLPEVFAKLVEGEVSLSIHIAESAEEFLLFKENAGPLFEFLAMKGQTPPTLGETPLAYLKRLNLLPKKTMAIHANYLEEADIDTLLDFEMSVVHCPGSHAYFEHDRFPLGMLQDAGVNVALGTDSLASGPSLSMLEQMRLALDRYAELTPQTVLKMATINGARALLREKEIGSIAPGKRANIIGTPLRFPKKDIYENILMAEKATFTMIRGQATFSYDGR